MTVHLNAIEQYSTVVLLGFQFYVVCNFGKFTSFALDTVRSESQSLILIRPCFFFRSKGGGLSVELIVGLSLGGAILLVLVTVTACYFRKRRQNKGMNAATRLQRKHLQ